MDRNLFKLIALIAVLALVQFSCDKDDENDTNSDNSYNGKTSAVFNPNISYKKMTDQDGNVYKTVKIGTQTWMAENLRTTKYNDGSAIPNVTSDNIWITLTTGAYCNYKNTNNSDSIATYGRLYNYYAVNTGKLAPNGWHVPTDAEWTTLTTYLDGFSGAGSKLKEIGTTHWSTPNSGANNTTGFTALPGGYRYFDGSFYHIGYYSNWWSAKEGDTYDAGYHCMGYEYRYVSKGFCSSELGYSVRCVRD